MTASVLTPSTIWGKFNINENIKDEIISEKVENNFVITKLYFEGRKIDDECVKIFATKIKKLDSGVAPGIIIAQKYCDNGDLTFAFNLADKGYTSFLVDFGGKNSNEQFTIYPEKISYANYNKERADSIEVLGSAIETCFYEWTCVMLYSYKYLSQDALINKIGAIAIDEFANALWQAIGIYDFSCAVVIGNAGRRSYKGINKFSDALEKTLSDNEVKFVAGIDSQSYANRIKCPVLLLCPTNSPIYDVDRAYDIISVIPENNYKAVNYSVGSRFTVDYKSYKDIILFFDAFLNFHSLNDFSLPKEIGIKAELCEGKINIEVSPDEKYLKNLRVFCGEDIEDSKLRMWQVVSNNTKSEDGKFIFEYRPYKNSSSVMFFARAEYENDFRICSNIICKKFAKDEIEGKHRYKVLYTSRIEDGKRFFSPLYENETKPTGIDIFDTCPTVIEKKGPFDMFGLYARGGLLTFKISAEKYKPLDDELLMLDASIQGGGEIEVSLVSDFFNSKQKYSAKSRVKDGVWQNIKFTLSDFKNENNASLKSYDNIDSIEINSDKEFIVNNILWL